MERTVREKLSGFTFSVRPTVFNPADFVSSRIFADYIKTLDLSGKYILDIGSGCGIVSVFAASKGAKCVASDINPMAVRCISENAALNKFSSQIQAVESDLFEALTNIPDSGNNSRPSAGFDIIFFNPPYYRGNPKDNFERAFKGGPGLEVIDRFLAGAKNFLAPRGKLCIIVSSDIDLKDFYLRLTGAGYDYKIIHSVNKFFETFYIIEAVI